MTNDLFYKIPASDLDKDISQLENDIREKQEKLDLLLSIRDYVTNKYKPEMSAPRSQLEIAITDSLFNHSVASLEISDFILDYLSRGGEKETKDILMAYASYKRASPDSVRNNIGNALSRLKASGKLVTESAPNIKGSIYKLVKEKAELQSVK
jgi:hypothetical protein